MDFTALKLRTAERVDEDTTTAIFWTNTEIEAAINRAQRLFALLTLCIERQAQTLSLTSGQTHYDVSSTFTDWLLPLRIKASTARVLPLQSHELDLRNEAWEATSGTPTHYFMKGLYFLGVYPKPTGGSLSVTYAGEPTALSAGADVPEIPEEFHPAIVDYAVYRLRWKEGARELSTAMPLLQRFLEEARRCSSQVRARSVAQGLDRVPFDLEKFDISRLVRPLKLQHVPIRKLKEMEKVEEGKS